MSADSGFWWQRFFSGTNGLRWEALAAPDHPWSADVLPWIALAQTPDPDLPIILPRLGASGTPCWYCAARGTRGALRLREALLAFVGPSYSNFDGRPYTLRLTDDVEAALAEGTEPPAYLIRPASPADVVRIRRTLLLYRGVLERMPRQNERDRRPMGFLRAELDRAVLAGDEAEARRLLAQIRQTGRLDAENLLFLEVGLRAGLGHWRDIAEDTELLADLTGLRLPASVLTDVVESLYRVHVEPSEDVQVPGLARAAFEAAGLRRRGLLFASRRGIQRPRVIKAFFLHELSREDPDRASLEVLAGALRQLVDDPFAVVLAGLFPEAAPAPVPTPSATVDPLAAADDAFTGCEIDRAFSLYLAAPPSIKRLIQLIRCAEEIGTVEAATTVMANVGASSDAAVLPDAVRRKLLVLERIGGRAPAEALPTGWLEWARWVTPSSADEALSVVRDHGPTWGTAALLHRPADIEEFARILGNAEGVPAQVFRESYPYFYRWLVLEAGDVARSLKPLVQVMLAGMAMLDDPSRDELELARDLVVALLSAGLDERDYADLIADLQELQRAQASLVNLNWSLDLAELLVTYPCADTEARLRFVTGVVEAVQRFAHRLLPVDRLVVEDLCRDLEITCPASVAQRPEAADTDYDDRLSGKKVGIYTLTEQAGQRAVALLERLSPTVDVELNGDQECTKRLIALARNADLFVFAWKSSKHQAYYCVKDHRPADQPFLQPLGKGSSSILRAIMDGV